MRLGPALAGLALAAAAAAAESTHGESARLAEPDPRVAERLLQVTRSTAWTPVATIPLRFRTYHPQGMVRIGRYFYLSSVEVRVRPRAVVGLPGGQDRDVGEGVGHLFRFRPDGAMDADVRLGEGALYHPGGLDFDGRRIWAPVSEYRPNSRTVIYSIDPRTLGVEEAFRVSDHIGAVAFDRSRRELHGLSWGSRTSYRWRISEAAGRVRAVPAGPPLPNRFGYIDHQDCHYVGGGRMLCGGLAAQADGPWRFQLGGLELIDLADHRPVWQLPVPLRSATGRPMTQNPMFVEATATGLRAYFIPDDEASTLYVYDIAAGAGASPSARPGGVTPRR